MHALPYEACVDLAYCSIVKCYKIIVVKGNISLRTNNQGTNSAPEQHAPRHKGCRTASDQKNIHRSGVGGWHARDNRMPGEP